MAPATTASPTPARSRGFNELTRFIVFLSLFVRALLRKGTKTDLFACANCDAANYLAEPRGGGYLRVGFC